jgi:hypothetical protein
MLYILSIFLNILDITDIPEMKITVSVFIALSFLFLNTIHGSASMLEIYGQMMDAEHQRQIQTNADDKKNIVRLLAALTQSRLEEATNILEVTSKQDEVRNTPYFGNISQLHMGIPENLDVEKRNAAKEILGNNKDFGSIYFTMPNGDVYIGEPFYHQKQLPRLNFADRDWYKGVTTTNNTYTSSAFVSASIHAPATAIAIPVYSVTENNNISNNGVTSKNNNLIKGYWVGIIDLQSVNQTIEDLSLDNNSQIIIVDHQGNEIVNSNISKNVRYVNADTKADNNSTHELNGNEHISQTELNSLANLESVKKALSGNSGSGVEIVDGREFSITYQPFKAGIHTWAVLLMSKT